MVHYWCKCQKCGGKLVGRATWYRHNEQRVRQRNLYQADASAGTGDGHAPRTLSNPPSDVYVKEPSPEDMDLEADSERASRSDPVGVVC